MGTLSWPEILIIAAINILLGWTVLGWIAALAWAVAGDTAPSPGSFRGFE